MSATDFIARHDTNMRSIALGGLELKATHFRDDAESVKRYLRILEDMPIYDTLAEGALDMAEASLAEATEAVRLAKEQIAKFRA